MNDRDLARTGEDLARFRAVRASDAFRARLRAELLAAPVVLAAPRRTPWWRPAAVAASVVLALALGAGSAAAASLPGEPAFALKRAAEELQLLVVPDDAARARLALEIADRRLAELEASSTRSDLAPTAAAAYADAWARAKTLLDAVRAAPPSEKKERALEHATAEREKHVEVLEVLRERLPEPARKGIDRAKDAQEKAAPRSSDDKKDNAPGRPSTPPGRSR